VGPSFFPLDEELQLLPGNLTPHLHEQLVRTGVWIPSFARAVELWASFTGAQVSEATARRCTEEAGAQGVRLQEQAVQELLASKGPAEGVGAQKQFLSADGANVPLVGGNWTEVKTLVIGEVQPAFERHGEQVVEVSKLTYFSRHAEAEEFRRAALVETHRRGVATAGQVGAVTDGSEWLQGLVDYHRRDALRILDFPHAGEHIAAIGREVYGEESPVLPSWLSTQLHTLKHDGPSPVLDDLERLLVSHPGPWAHSPPPTDADPDSPTTHLAYLQKRADHMQYPAYQAAGWPIGDGATESANKLVVEERLKGSGMHWALRHVNPMLALRNVVCNDRWDETWPQIAAALRQVAWQRHQARRKARAECSSPPPTAVPTARPSPNPGPTALASNPSREPVRSQSQPTPDPPHEHEPHRPAANHPWRHSPIGRARFQSSLHPKL